MHFPLPRQNTQHFPPPSSDKRLYTSPLADIQKVTLKRLPNFSEPQQGNKLPGAYNALENRPPLVPARRLPVTLNPSPTVLLLYKETD